MDRLIKNIVNHLYKQSDFQILEIHNFQYNEIELPLMLSYDLELNELFICTIIDSNDLNLTNLKLQVRLNEYLKSNQEILLQNIEKNVSNFEKNTTLIIFTNKTSTETLKKAIEIEEDPYFFKKHVLILNENEIEILKKEFDDHKELFHSKLKSTINDLDLFNKFSINEKSDNVAFYGVVAKLYEKLPFLKLPIDEFSKINLLTKIDQELKNAELFNIRNELLLLTGNTEINLWIDDLIKENENG